MALDQEEVIDAGIGARQLGKTHQFFEKTVMEVPQKTLDHGSPQFEDRLLFVKLIPGGDRAETWVKDSKVDEFKKRYPNEWRRYESAQKGQVEGTDLAGWGAVTEGQRRTFQGMNVFSVEQVANLPDGVLQRFGIGGLELRKKAIEHIEEQKASKHNAVLRNEVTDLRAQIAELQKKFGTQEETKPQVKK